MRHLLFIVATAIGGAFAETDTLDFSSVFGESDSAFYASLSSEAAMVSEEEAVEQAEPLMVFDVDTTNWNTSKINAGRFDYRTMSDTVRIVLVDSTTERTYVHPAPGQVTSQFGPRRGMWHYGVDTRLSRGDTIRSALDGIVRVVQFDRRGYGLVVLVRHHDGLETIYAHLSKSAVSPGTVLKAGDAVGLGGSTGRSSGPHLHYEWRYYGEPFNPNHIVDFAQERIKSDTLVLCRDDFEYLTVIRQTVYHRIRSGDNLGKIARRYGTSVNALCRMNAISGKTILRVGRRIVVRRPPPRTQELVRKKATPSTPDTITRQEG